MVEGIGRGVGAQRSSALVHFLPGRADPECQSGGVGGRKQREDHLLQLQGTNKAGGGGEVVLHRASDAHECHCGGGVSGGSEESHVGRNGIVNNWSLPSFQFGRNLRVGIAVNERFRVVF